MKIAIVSEVYYPHIGGMSEHIYHLKQNLAKLGHQVKILTASFGDNHINENQDIVRMGRGLKIRKAKSYYSITVGYGLSHKVKKFLTDGKFDIIHTHGPLAPVLPYLAIKYSNAVNFATFHSALDTSIGYALFEPVLERYFRKIHGPIAVSEVARKAMAKYFPGEYRIIPNGVDTDRFNHQINARPELRHRKPLILFVGRCEPRKGLEFLIKAFPLVVKTIPEVTLVIVGAGYDDCYYKKKIDRAMKEKIIIAGQVHSDQLPSYYASCDIFCSPAIGLESFGIVLLEAMASGRPVVASNIEGYNNVLTDSVEGMLVKPKDPSALASVIIKLLQNARLRKKMGEAGRTKALDYDWRKITRRIESYYLEVIERERSQKSIH